MPFDADDERADDERRERRRRAIAAGSVSHRLAASYLGASSAERVGADAEERRMAERDEAGVADQQIERQREDREDHHLGDELGVERRAGEREEREQRERDADRDAPPLQRATRPAPSARDHAAPPEQAFRAPQQDRRHQHDRR